MNILDLTRYRQRLNEGQMGLVPFSLPAGQYSNILPPGPFGSIPTPTYQTPPYNPGNNTVIGPAQPVPSGSSTQHYFNTIASLVSQIFSGTLRNPTNQVYQGVGVLPNPNVQIAQALAPQQQQYAQGQGYQQQAPGGLASGLGSGLDGMISWAMANPIYPIGGAIILWLLFKTPPGKK